MVVSPVPSQSSSGMAYYAGTEEYVVALHDFSSQNKTCLAFQSGQVIKVYNRDSSGWWDGELDGARGWFPSNYVDQDGLLATSSNGRISSLSHDDQGAMSSYHPPGNAIGLQTSGLYEPYEDEYGQRPGVSSSTSSNTTAADGGTPLPPPIPTRSSSSRRHGRNGSGNTGGRRSAVANGDFDTILEPILHAIALLHNAVRANRVAHFQPSTACVISSVRSVLSATDCLTRESAVLKAHSVLSKERKQILSELTRLVQQSKKASGVMVDESQRGTEMDRMLEMAELVLGHVRRFLEVADECGIAIPDRRASLYEEVYEDRRGGMPVIATMPNGNSHGLAVDDGRSTNDNRSSAYYTTFTSGQFSPRSSRSFADLRSTHSRSVYVNSHEDDAGMLGVSYVPRSEYRNTMRTTVTTATTAAQYHGTLSSSPPDSLHRARLNASRNGTLHGKAMDGMNGGDDDNADNHPDDDDDDLSAGDQSDEPAKCTPAEVLERIASLNDDLLSVIAAFIGHVHTHTRQSHASSFAHLIDMTRETVDAVRNLLTVVEAVSTQPDLAALRGKEMALLFEGRESLYEATTSLVTAARNVTATGNTSNAATSGGNATPPNTEEDEKARLLAVATGVLRTGVECVGSVRLCLGRANPTMLIAVPELTKPRSQTAGQHSGTSSANANGMVEDEEDDLDEDAGERIEDSNGVMRRGKHTLSFLGRKATSLSCLKEKYERDGYQTAFDGILEAETDDAEAGSGKASTGDGDTEMTTSGSAGDNSAEKRESRSRSASSAPRPSGGSTDSPSLMQQDSSPEIDIGGNVTSSGRFDGPARPNGEFVRSSKQSRVSDIPPVPAVTEVERKLSRLVLPNGSLVDQIKARRNSGGTSSDGDGSRVSNNSASTSAGSLVGSLSLTRSARSGSEATVDTSARPSLERMESDFPSHAVDTVPHSAPLLGKFPRELPPGTQSSLGSSVNTPSEDGTVVSSIPVSVSDSQIETGVAVWPQRRSSDSKEPIYMQPDYDPDDVFYKEGRLSGASLAALVEKMTPHDTMVDQTLSATFYLCFRLFTTPMDLFDAFVARYNLQLPAGVTLTEQERTTWLERKVTPVRLRVFNFFKLWLETHYVEASDSVILPKLIDFTRTSMNTATMARHGQRLAELAQRRLSASGIRSGGRGPTALQRAYSTDMLRPKAAVIASQMYMPTAFPRNGAMPPQPVIKDKLMAALRTGDWKGINIMEIDPTELARQITIMGSKLYCSIEPEELLAMDGGSKKAAANGGSGPGAGGVQSYLKAMSTLSTAISGWINESILGEEDVRKRVQLLKFFIKLGDRLLVLNNYDGLFAVHAALGSAQIDRLRQTWDALPTKYRGLMEQQREAASFAKNWQTYRQRLRMAQPPALPFLGIFLTDLTFVYDGNAKFRPSPNAPDRALINMDRYFRISAVILDLQRFQVPYTLLEVPEMQSLLKSVLANLSSSNGIDSAQDLYQRSKALEPRPSEATLSGRVRENKGGLDIFNWK